MTFVNEQELRRFLADADDEFSFADCSQLEIRHALRWKRKRTIHRATAIVAMIACIVIGWQAVSRQSLEVPSALVKNLPEPRFDAAAELQRVADQLQAIRETLSQEQNKMDELHRMVTTWNQIDIDVAESTSLVDLSYAFHLQNNVGENDLATKEFERITRDSPGTHGAKIAAETLIAFRQP